MSAPFMQLYVGDYLADTLDLTCEEHGAYLLLLMTMWRHDAKLPSDPKKLARIVRLSGKKWLAVWAEIGKFFDDDGTHITNKRLTKEHQKATEKSKVRATAGSTGGKAKALKDNDARLANASALPQHSSEPEPDIRKRETKVSQAREAVAILASIVPEQLASDFAEHRRGLKKPLTPTAAAAMVSKLTGHHDPAAVLTDSIANGWQGIFPEKHKPQLTAINGGQYVQRNGTSGRAAQGRADRPDPALEQILRLAGLGQTSGDGGA